MPPRREPELSESQARRASALKSALGPLTDLLDDPRVIEVMLNADGVVWVERVGEGVLRTRITVSAADADRMLRLVASEAAVELNPQSPSLSAKLPSPWGARLQAAIPPIVDAPVFALRKPSRIVFSLDDYVSRGILSPRQRSALADAVRAHDNILIGGGTGSGKTTFANALVKVIAEDTTDRAHIVEDTPELQCEAPNRLQVLVQPGVHSWRDAIMAAMRFRPDRILVGEVRDGSALGHGKAFLIDAESSPMEHRDRDWIGNTGGTTPSTGSWRSIEAAARILGVPTITLRRLIGRSARRASDGSVEARVDGIRARKLGRHWRVWLHPSWTGPAA